MVLLTYFSAGQLLILKYSIFRSVCTMQIRNLLSHYWDAMHKRPQYVHMAVLIKHTYAAVGLLVSADHTGPTVNEVIAMLEDESDLVSVDI